MPSLIREPRQESASSDRQLFVLGGFLVTLFATFLLAPGSAALKTHIALHGLCAQRSSHSLQIGGAELPMDARMTGIYIGAAVAVCWLMAANRLKAIRVPSPMVLILMSLFVVTLAIDGFNGLLVDLGVAHPYEPTNLLRLVTGLLAGSALGIAIGHLFAISVWERGDRNTAVVMSPFELLVPIGISGAIVALAQIDLSILYAPFAVGLLFAAVGVFSLLATVVVVLVSGRGWSCKSIAELLPFAITGLVVAISTIAGLSALRFVAEQYFGLSQLT